MSANTKVIYTLFAQNRDNTIVIKNINLNTYMVVKATEVLANRKLMKGLPSRDINIIKFIATA